MNRSVQVGWPLCEGGGLILGNAIALSTSRLVIHAPVVRLPIVRDPQKRLQGLLAPGARWAAQPRPLGDLLSGADVLPSGGLEGAGTEEEVDDVPFVRLQPVELDGGHRAEVEAVDVGGVEQLLPERSIFGDPRSH